MDYSRELEIAKAIAAEAGKIMLHYWNGDQQQEIKSDGSPVTIADKEINHLVIAKIKATFPDDDVVGEEESTSDYGMGRQWLCDPIDGTKSYVLGVPTALFSLALVVDGRPLVGVAYDPYLDKLYTAIVGKGSFCNDEKLAVSRTTLEGSAIAVTGNLRRVIDKPRYIQRLLETGAEVISFDSAVYKVTLIARGRLAGYIGRGAGPYDIAAGEVIVSEAGGRVTGLDGKPLDYSQAFRGVIVSNSTVHDELVEIVQEIE